MMSLSDKVKDEFKPIDISSLESFDDERINQAKDSEPDWERFKVFFEDLKAEQKAADPFKALFDKEEDTEEKEEIVFEQLGDDEAEEAPEGQVPQETDSKGSEDVIDEIEKPDADHHEAETRMETVEPTHGSHDKSESDNIQNDQKYDQGFETGEKEGYAEGLEQGKKDGHEQGMKEGHSEGYANGEKEAAINIQDKISKKSEEFEEVLLKMDNTYQELAARYEEKMISLICKISEKVVLAKVEIDEEIVKKAVLEALRTLPEPEDITLSVSEEDYEYIEMVKEDLFDSIKSLKSVFVKSDASVKRGGCRIETKEGYIETDIESKLEKVFSSIKGKDII
jgi:flagellar assembly protein FliH